MPVGIHESDKKKKESYECFEKKRLLGTEKNQEFQTRVCSLWWKWIVWSNGEIMKYEIYKAHKTDNSIFFNKRFVSSFLTK